MMVCIAMVMVAMVGVGIARSNWRASEASETLSGLFN